MFNLAQRLNKPEIAIDEAVYQYAYDHRGCLPGVITDVNTSPNVYGSTVNVQIAMVENVTDPNTGITGAIDLQVLQMVPLAIIGAGEFFITLPVRVGDEGLLIFQDMCIDGAWQSAGVSNQQLDKRRHDLADAIFLPLRWTQPSTTQLPNYSQSSLQIRSIDGTTVIDITEGQITITAGSQVQLAAPLISMGMAGGAIPLPLVNDNWFQWFVTNVYPFLVGLGYTGPIVPVNSETTITMAS